MLDDLTFKDERQWVQIATGSLTAAFLGCRPCSLFDTRVKLDDPDDSDIPANDTVVASPPGARKAVNDVEMDEIKGRKSYRDGDTRKSIGGAYSTDGGSSKSCPGTQIHTHPAVKVVFLLFGYNPTW